MFKHIAVLIRGHERCWANIHSEVFEFWSSIAENVDYYVVTWRSTTKNNYNIPRTFDGQNLIKFLEVYPHQENYFCGYRGPAFMGYLISPYMRERQKLVTYDAVFDTRPDIYYRRKVKNNEYLSIIPPEDNCIYIEACESHIRNRMEDSDPLKGLRSIAINDWWFMMKPETFYIINERWIDEGMTGGQIQYREFAESRGISVCTTDWVETVIVRPFTPDMFEEGRLDSYHNWGVLQSHRHGWSLLPKAKKEEYIRNSGQAMEDYNTPSMVN